MRQLAFAWLKGRRVSLLSSAPLTSACFLGVVSVAWDSFPLSLGTVSHCCSGSSPTCLGTFPLPLLGIVSLLSLVLVRLLRVSATQVEHTVTRVSACFHTTMVSWSDCFPSRRKACPLATLAVASLFGHGSLSDSTLPTRYGEVSLRRHRSRKDSWRHAPR